MTAFSEIDTVEHFKELPFYKKPIEKSKIKQLKKIDRLVELPFCKQKRKFSIKIKSSVSRVCNVVQS